MKRSKLRKCTLKRIYLHLFIWPSLIIFVYHLGWTFVGVAPKRVSFAGQLLDTNLMQFEKGSFHRNGAGNASFALTESNPSFSCKNVLEQRLTRQNESETQDFFRKPVEFNKLWLSWMTAPSLLKGDGHIESEDHKVLNLTELLFVLKALTPPTEIDILLRARCQECVVVGSGGCLRDKKLGIKIDGFPIVIRVNQAPVKTYEEDVGSRTDIRVLYPESASADEYLFKGEGIVVMAPFNHDDFLWVAKQANKSLQVKLKNPRWRNVPVDFHKIAVLNPHVKDSWGRQLTKENQLKRTRPTTGTLAILMALNLCNSVSLAGFCYNFTSPQNYLYYYGSQKIGMKENYGAHTMGVENKVRMKLFQEGFFNVLTSV